MTISLFFSLVHKKIFILLVLVFSLLINPCNLMAQQGLWADQVTIDKIHTAIQHIYNLDFAPADKIIKELDTQLQGEQALLLLKAFRILWKHMPLKEGTPAFQDFETLLREVITKSAEELKKDKNDLEASFFMLAAHGYLAQIYVDNDLKMKALGEAKNAYSYIKAGFDATDAIPEYLFPCGLYNYYRVRYPEENPFYKPFLWIFRSGDKDEGIRMLKEGTNRAVFTQVECYIYLYHIYFRYEFEPKLAEPYVKNLVDRFPNNPIFASHYAELLLYLRQYQKSLTYIDQLINASQPEYRYQGAIFKGMYLELHKKNYVEALKSYQKAEKLSAQVSPKSLHRESLLYLGIGRTHKTLGNTSLARDNLRKAVNLAEYSFVRDEARNLQ
ncbi:MAG: tetratricopeptide repeat protein [Cyclobacteriaceae bacterium]|nr:tetratricopeptide repeat protein [Cyclobacteriaceae bacterium]